MSNNFGLTFTGRIRSFKCAIKGIWVMISSQHNAWIHAAATVVVVAVGFYFRLTRSEWIILAVISVWMAQALNTAFEFLTDVASPEFHPLAEKAKDVAAGAVLIAAIGSVIIGLIVLGPHALAKRQMAVSVALWVVGGCAGRPAPVVDLPQRISESFGSEAKYPTARGRRPMPAKFVGDDETLIRSSEPVSSPMIIGEAERCQFKLKKPLCMPASAGYDAIAAVADDLLQRLTTDAQLSRFWQHRGEDGVRREKQLLIDFLCASAGGPLYYTGRDMATSHRGMRISEGDWTTFVSHLNATLDSFAVPERERSEVLAFVNSTKSDIVE